jgi:integrase
MANSSHKRKLSKPKKPKKDFPLYAHAAGRWAKKVLGRTFYFTKWKDDPKGKAALEEWLEQKDDLLAGREPSANNGRLTLYQLCNDRFLPHKEGQRDVGDITPLTFNTYVATSKILCACLGKSRPVESLVPDDFRKLKTKLAKTRKEVALRNVMQRVRSIFKFAYDEGLIDRPARFGQGFAKPKQRTVRTVANEHRMKYGDRMFEAHEIRQILDALKDNPQLKAMVLLGANCGFGQSDISALPKRALDLDTGWVDFPRPKTAVGRRIPLWPETIDAIREYLPSRPKAKTEADAGLLFLTTRKVRWIKVDPKTGNHGDAIGQEFGKLLRRLDLKRPGLGFYALRHGFETIAGETLDQVSVDSIMGHVAHGMAEAYRERIGDNRLRDVVEHVRRWLFDLGGDGNLSPGTNTAEDRDTLPQEEDGQDPLTGGLKLFVG